MGVDLIGYVGLPSSMTHHGGMAGQVLPNLLGFHPFAWYTPLA